MERFFVSVSTSFGVMEEKIPESEEEWRERLNEREFKVLRKRGTEPAGSGDLLHNEEEGIYRCKGCGQKLFSSKHKFESGTGWPSFYKPAEEEKIETQKDFRMAVPRTEVLCSRCGGHLGHVFDDGPEPTGKRYCINSVALKFEEI